MRGFLTLAKTIVYTSSMVKPTQQIRMQFRLANQLLASQFRFCSTIQALRLTNLFGAFSNSLQEDADVRFGINYIKNTFSNFKKQYREDRILEMIILCDVISYNNQKYFCVICENLDAKSIEKRTRKEKEPYIDLEQDIQAQGQKSRYTKPKIKHEKIRKGKVIIKK